MVALLQCGAAALVVGRLSRPVLPFGVVIGAAVVMSVLAGEPLIGSTMVIPEMTWETGVRSIGVGLTIGLVLGIPFLLASVLASFLAGTVSWRGTHSMFAIYFVALIARSGALERFVGRAFEVSGTVVEAAWVIRLGADIFRAAFQTATPLLVGMILVDLSCAVLRRYSRLWEPVLYALRLPALLLIVALFLAPLSERIEREIASRLDAPLFGQSVHGVP